ncbi:coiled-coil domain-containing protein 144A-like [Molossus nigricans]
MKKIFTWRRQESSSSGSSTSMERSRVGDRELGYHIQRKDLGKIHKAATEGNIEKIKQILLSGRNDVNYRDKKNRTALHLACVCGHPAVVSLLADSQCLLDLCDLDNRTPLIKAVQCQQEECVAALLDHGADPDIRDIDGNSALHHAVLGESVAILAKLLLSNANMEVRNQDNLTPLSLAESGQKMQMMALLIKKGTEFEKMKRMNRLTPNDKGFKIEEERKKQNIIKMEVTKEIHQAAGEDGHGLIKPRDCKQTDNQPFPLMENDNSDRTSEEICPEEYKVKENINSMDDLDDLTQSTETVSDPYSNCKNFILLIGELCKNCKDLHSLYEIQDAVLSFQKSMEHGNNQCELLTKEVKIMKKSIRKLQRELSETREIKSQLEHQKVELKGELSNLRLTLQEEKEKRQKADLLSEKTKKQLIKIEEEFIKETEKNRELETTVETLELKLKTSLENSDWNDYLKEILEAVSSNCLHLEEKKYLQQKLLSIKLIETECKILENENKKLKEEVINLRRHIKTNMVERSELEHYKQAEKRAREDAAEQIQEAKLLIQLHSKFQEHSSSIQRHLELRIRDLESEIIKMQTSLHFNNMDMKNYMALYQEELEKRKLLENELNETKNKMVQVHAELFQQKENYRDLLSTIQTRPVLQTPCAVNTNSNTDTGCMPSTQCTPGKRAALPIIEEMMKEFDKKVEEALKDGSVSLHTETAARKLGFPTSQVFVGDGRPTNQMHLVILSQVVTVHIAVTRRAIFKTPVIDFVVFLPLNLRKISKFLYME